MQTNTDFEANGFRNRWPAVYPACKFVNGFVWPFKEMELERTCYMIMYRFRTNEYFRVGRGDPYFATNPKNETHSGFGFGFSRVWFLKGLIPQGFGFSRVSFLKGFVSQGFDFSRVWFLKGALNREMHGEGHN